MRRSLSVLVPLLLLITPSLLPAQRHFERIRRAFDRDATVEIGLVGGPNRNTVTGAGPVDARFRGSLGGFLSVPVLGALRVRPEIGVSGKLVGFLPSCPVTELCQSVQGDVASFTWLEAPILFEARFPRALGRSAIPRVYAGPFVAVRLSCSFATPVGTTGPQAGQRLVRSCDESGQNGVRYNNGDAGFVLGGAIAVGGVGVGMRWTRSLVPIAEFQSATDFTPLQGAKHSTLALTLELGTRLF